MFIKVRFGEDEVLLCNPQCRVNNLLDSITSRCGLKHTGRILDLSDDTGLVLRLNDHREDYADLYLSNHTNYILVEKQGQGTQHNLHEDTPLTSYVPLLNNCSTLLPKFKLRVSIDTTNVNPHRHLKSPRPTSKVTNHGHVAHKSPTRRSKRSKTKIPKDAQ